MITRKTEKQAESLIEELLGGTRRRDINMAIALSLMLHAPQRGCRIVVLSTGQSGFCVYKKLGFQE